mgnify:CR=1 FL=1|tara:strand:+ start:319 stop:1044 length:726 start_codon:yes stop_codon:yes gene_type:complete
MKKKIEFSLNYSKKTRKKKDIKFIVFHYTGMQSEIESLKRLKDRNSQVSCHYLISRNGNIISLVEDTKIAWHAGKSKWGKFVNLNKNSIGIELVNKGHELGYQNFPKSQINSLIKLCLTLKRKYKIKNVNFLGHSDIAPLRKMDPGEKFPWKKLSKFKIGSWYPENIENAKNNKNLKSKNTFFRNLKKIGYKYFNTSKRAKNDKFIIKAFQQRYIPKKITGKIDQKNVKISHYLANSTKST